MLHRIKKVLRSISDVGLQHANSEFQARYIAQSNQMTLACIGIATIFNINFALNGEWKRVMIQLTILLALELPVFVYNHFGRNTLARASLILGVSLSIFIDAAIGGMIEGHQLFFLAMAIGTGIFFEPTNWRLGIFLFTTPLTLWGVLEVTHYKVLQSAFVVQTQELNVRFMNIFLSYLVVFTIVWRFSYNAMLAQQRAIMAEKMASLGILAAGVGHEINNPLAVILGQVHLMKDRASERGEQDNLHSADRIQSAAKRISAIVDSLRRFSRSDPDDPMEIHSLSSIILSCISLCNSRAVEHNVQITLEGPEANILCRDHEIIQILVNLISNSIDAIRHSEEPWIKISTRVKPSFIEVRIQDSGRGITKEIASKMMLPFFTTKPPGSGTGLGLSISHSIAVKHGGGLSLDPSESNTTFVLTLPSAKEIEAAA